MAAGTRWVMPIMAVLKTGGTICICGDFSVIVNPQTDLEEYFLPLLDGLDVLSRKVLSVLNQTQGYQYLKAVKESQEVPTLTTQEGCYRCLRFHMESQQPLPAIRTLSLKLKA
jgi:hypothetical protein